MKNLLLVSAMLILSHIVCFASSSYCAPKIPSSPESIHLTYSYSAINHKWPEAYRQSLISQTKEKIESLKKQPDGKKFIGSVKGCLALYESRGNDDFEKGRCAYWGTKNGWVWDNGKFAWTYNGKVIITSVAKNILAKPIPSDQKQPFLEVKINKADVDIVPYLGFQQPAKWLKSTKHHYLKKTNDGWEEISNVPDLNVLSRPKEKIYAQMLLCYDKLGRLKSVSKFTGKKLNLLSSCTTFSEYSSIPGGFVCPHRVVRKSYRLYCDRGTWRSFLSWATTYKLTTADTNHVDDSMFSVQHPPVNTHVVDYRYSSGTNPGVAYIYSNHKLTLDQASMAAARASASIHKERQTYDWGLLAVRYVSFAVVAMLLVSPMLRLVRINRIRGKS